MENQQQGAPPTSPPPLPGDYVPCPRCGSAAVRKVGFTWWGGILGPTLFTHCKCDACGATFNGKTGASNTGAITAYVIVSGVIVFAIVTFILTHK